MNLAPLVDVMMAGTPNLAIHPWNIACAQAAADVDCRGIASAHLVVLSMTVKRWVKPSEAGRGLTRSR